MIFRPIPRGSGAIYVILKCCKIFSNIFRSVKEIIIPNYASPHEVWPRIVESLNTESSRRELQVILGICRAPGTGSSFSMIDFAS